MKNQFNYASSPLSLRALASGTALGGLLSTCNIYMGLKVGWSINMSILAALLGSLALRHRRHGSLSLACRESNLQQTAASAAGGTVSAGLVAPIPAYLILTGEPFEFLPMVIWMIAISLLGVCVASAVRPTMLSNSRLRFPSGTATAAVITNLHTRSIAAKYRLNVLLISMLIAIGHRLVVPVGYKLSLGFSLTGKGAVAGTQISAKNLGFVIEPSYMLMGIGALIGPRAILSLLLGCLIAWLGLAPTLLQFGWVTAGPHDQQWFSPLMEWLLWPGVTMMTAASLITLLLVLFRSRSIHSLKPDWGKFEYSLLLLLTPMIVLLQMHLFNIGLVASLLSVPLAFLFAIIAAQVVGETGIPPVGALGKLSQLTYAVISPGQLTTNLMTGNVACGAAGQATDLLNDFKAGQILGTQPRHQTLAQCCGIFSGCVVSAAIFSLLFSHPANQLMTEQWPAPGVVAWSTIAKALTSGLHAIPAHTLAAILVAAGLAVVIELIAYVTPAHVHRWLPSAPAIGMGFVIPASITLMLVFGAVVAGLMTVLAPKFSKRYLIAMAAGFIAGESLAGVLGTLFTFLKQ